MSEEITRLLVDDDKPLTPSDAVVAIIVAGDRYLLQARDVMAGIFYPGHWGLFGGAMEEGESEAEALCRELDEELRLKVSEKDIRPFTTYTFDFGYLGGPVVKRAFYEIRIAPEAVDSLTLGEGREMRLFDARDALSPTLPVTPYDAFALWMHVTGNRVMFPDQASVEKSG